MPNDKKIQFIVCPKCDGSGHNQAGLLCLNCGGLGLGSFVDNKFLYWGESMGKATIKMRHLKKAINIFVNICFFTVGLIGLLSLAAFIFLYPKQIDIFTFWQLKHSLILLFWVGMMAELFVYYKLSIEKNSKKKINRFLNKKNTKLPNNWEELKKSKQNIDISKFYHENTIILIESAFQLAYKSKSELVTTKYLFFALLKNSEIMALFIRLNVDLKLLINKISEKLDTLEKGDGKKTELDVSTKEVLVSAFNSAYESKQKRVNPINLLLPLIEKDKEIDEILIDLGTDRQKVKNAIIWFIINEKLIDNYKKYKKLAKLKPGKNMNRAYTAVATPILDHFGYDLTIAAKWGRLSMCVGREEEMDRVFETIESGHYGIILTGESGVGKKTIIHGLAQKMVEEDVPHFLRDKRLVELDIARVVSGATAEKVQERLVLIIDEVIKSKNIILFIENIENIVGISSGKEESLELSEVLANSLDRRNISCIAIASNKNYSKYIESKALGESMKKIEIEEPSIDKAIQIVESKIGRLENKFKIYFSYNAIEAAVKLTNKYMKDSFLPEKAIHVLDQVSASLSKKCKIDKKQCLCTENDIAETINKITNIPVQKITEKESEKLLNLEELIHKRMINQKEAVEKVASSLRRARTEMREHKRPIASFLFLGPTGVGKTELAKTVAEIYFGAEKNMIRIDMSEYQLQDSLKKMIGSSSSMGYLTEKVRKNPFSLVLLDEFEKAHKDILNLFLQVMDDGRITDGQGRTIDFTNTIIVATSNVGALYIQDEIKKETDLKEVKKVLINEHLNKIIRPELINRFDGITVFKPLTEKNTIDIAKLLLNKTKRMLEEKDMKFEYDEGGVIELAHEGYDPKYGARHLRRLIQDKIENEIANKILSNELSKRDTVFLDKEANIKIIKANKS